MKISDRITKSINNIFLISLFSCYIAAGILSVYLINNQMKEQALHEAADRARLLLYRNLAEHDYFSKSLKPNLLSAISASHGKDYFDPCWMSSTYAVRQMDKGLKERISEQYYYKEAAINARSRENEADTYEVEFLNKLNHGSKVKEIQKIRNIDGQSFFTYMIQGETLEEECLRCHSTPGSAPKMLTKIYGDKKSFNRKVGEVISAISIRISLEDAFAKANEFSAKLSVILLLVLFILLSVHFMIYKTLIHIPILRLKNKTLEIINSREHLGDQIPIRHENELGELTKVFNWFSRNTKDLLHGLETKVRERTEKYEKTNIDLMDEICYRMEIETALKESEKRYRQLVEITPNAIIVVSDSRIAFANNSSLKLLGGKDIWEILDKDIHTFISRDTVKNKIEGVLDSFSRRPDKTFNTEMQIRDLAGNTIQVEVFLVPTVFNGRRAVQVIIHNIEHRKRTEQALKLSEQKFRSIFDHSPIGITILLDGQVVKANKSFVSMFGYNEPSEIENSAMSILLQNKSLEDFNLQNAEGDAEKPGNKIYELTGMKKSGEAFPVSAGFARLHLSEGSAVVAMVSDRTELKKQEEEVRNSLKEKETLLREIHHRVKNNLQIISSLLNLQMQFIEDEKLRVLFNDSCSRVRSMSLIHEKLYQTKSLSKIDMKDYILDLSRFLRSAYLRESQNIEIRADLGEVSLPVDMAVPCGLIINELVSNSLKYAFKGLEGGFIDILLQKDDEKIKITISDNGVGLPDSVNLENSTTLGLQLVSGLTEQVNGTIDILREEGTKFILTFSAA